MVGIPMYADIFGAIPVAEALLYNKGAQLGTILANFRICCVRACLKSPRACLGGVFSALTALKILAIRQDACGFLPCRAKNPLANPYTSRY